MKVKKSSGMLLHVLRAKSIARRYLVTNGFDGALTVLGIITGFYISGMTDVSVVLSASLGAVTALFVSGVSSAYLSEKAERQKELRELERALISDLKESDLGHASRYLPLWIALVNGFSPLLLSSFILLPLLFADQLQAWSISPFISAMVMALIVLFMIGVLLGKISHTFWLWSGLKTLLVAIFTVALILVFGRVFD